MTSTLDSTLVMRFQNSDRKRHGTARGERTHYCFELRRPGDALQFARYAPMIKEATGAHIVMEAMERLILLIAMPGIDQIISSGSSLPQFDFDAAMFDLPRL